MSMRQFDVLLLEDEKNVGLTLLEGLPKEGFFVQWVRSQQEALDAMERKIWDLALLDIMLSEGSGFEVAQYLRKKQPTTAILFLTACGNPEYRIRGLELGAEDYIVKPFHFKELVLRMKKSIKRCRFLTQPLEGVENGMVVGKARIYLLKFEAQVGDQSFTLTYKEVALLRLLLERRGQVVSRDEMLNVVWSENEFPTPRTVDNFVMRLRRLVEINPESPEVIKSVRGIGYQLI